MKKYFIFISIFVIFVAVFICNKMCFVQKKNKENLETITINVYNWGEYISNGSEDSLNVNEEFTKRTGIKVNYSTFQSNEALYAKMQSGGTKYDVIIPSDYMISKMIKNNMLRKINLDNIPNYSYIDDEFKYAEYDPQNEYSVPYTWGLVGIFYNKKFVDEPEIGWDIFWNKKYSGKMLMFDNPRDAFAIAQIKLGLDLNSINPLDWEKAANELKTQKPLIQSYVMDQIFDKMASNEAILAPYYVGHAALLRQINPDIECVVPKSGTNKFVDAMCIPAESEHPAEAEQYINFMCDPEIALENIKYIGYSTPETKVKNSLDPEFANDEICYPPEDILKKSQTFTHLPDNIIKIMNESWISIKAGESGNPISLFLMIFAFAILYLCIIILKRLKHKN